MDANLYLSSCSIPEGISPCPSPYVCTAELLRDHSRSCTFPVLAVPSFTSQFFQCLPSPFANRHEVSAGLILSPRACCSSASLTKSIHLLWGISQLVSPKHWVMPLWTLQTTWGGNHFNETKSCSLMTRWNGYLQDALFRWLQGNITFQGNSFIEQGMQWCTLHLLTLKTPKIFLS